MRLGIERNENFVFICLGAYLSLFLFPENKEARVSTKTELVAGRVVIPVTHICLLLLWKK